MNPFCCSSSCVLLCFQAVLVMFHSHIQPRFSFSNPRNYLNWLHFHFPESEMAKWLCWKFFPSLDIMWYEKVCVRANTWNSSLSLLSESVLCYLCNDRQEHTLTHTGEMNGAVGVEWRLFHTCVRCFELTPTGESVLLHINARLNLSSGRADLTPTLKETISELVTFYSRTFRVSG